MYIVLLSASMRFFRVNGDYNLKKQPTNPLLNKKHDESEKKNPF